MKVIYSPDFEGFLTKDGEGWTTYLSKARRFKSYMSADRYIENKILDNDTQIMGEDEAKEVL